MLEEWGCLVLLGAAMSLLLPPWLSWQGAECSSSFRVLMLQLSLDPKQLCCVSAVMAAGGAEPTQARSCLQMGSSAHP